MPEDRKPQKIELRLTAGGRGSKIFIDGTEVRYVTAVRLTAEVDDVPRLALEIVAVDGVTVNGEAVADLWRRHFELPKLKDEERFDPCPHCGFRHAPAPVVLPPGAAPSTTVERFCCKCGARPGRLPYGWCEECADEAPRE